jgi:predicted dehydrogenase
MAKKIKLGIIGGGGDSLIGVLHRVASAMHDQFEIVGGVFNLEIDKSIAFAEKIGLRTDRLYRDFDAFVEEEAKLPESERIQVVSVLTPNFLHFPMAKKLVDNGFHVICEKPLTTTLEEAIILENAAKKAKTVFAVTYTYTGYPIVRQMRQMIQSGLIGEVHKVDVQYYQGWVNPILHDKKVRDTIWRLDPKKAGISSCIGDIGTHAFNMAEYLTGKEVKSILADLNTRYKDVQLDVDGTVLIRFSEYVKGVIRASQIATGEENGLSVKIYGSKGGFNWKQEEPNFLYHLSDDKPVQILKPGHAYNGEVSLDGTKLPPGHPEGIFDSMGNIYYGVAKAVRGLTHDSGEYPGIKDGVRGMKFIEKCVASHKLGNVWLDL